MPRTRARAAVITSAGRRPGPRSPTSSRRLTARSPSPPARPKMKTGDQHSKCSVRDPLWKIRERILVGAAGPLDHRAGGRHQRANPVTLTRPRCPAFVEAFSYQLPVNPIHYGFAPDDLVDPRVLEAMLPFFTEHFWQCLEPQPSVRMEGRQGCRGRTRAGRRPFGAASRTSCSRAQTESNNLAIKGVAAMAPQTRRHIVTVATEHPARQRPVPHARSATASASHISPVRPDGLIGSRSTSTRR